MQQNSNGNLGVAVCNFGMGWLMYTKTDYFTSKDCHDEKVLRNAVSHFQIAEQIY